MAGKAWIGVVLAVVCVSSVGFRHVFGDSSPEPEVKTTSSRNNLVGGNSLVPQSSTTQREVAPAKPKENSFIAKSLPFVTEASFFGLIGFALGYFSKKVVKLMLIFIAIMFMALQGLSYLEVLTMDWQKLIDVVNGLILNLKQNDSISAVLQDRIPTAGALVTGYFLGFRRG